VPPAGDERLLRYTRHSLLPYPASVLTPYRVSATPPINERGIGPPAAAQPKATAPALALTRTGSPGNDLATGHPVTDTDSCASDCTDDSLDYPEPFSMWNLQSRCQYSLCRRLGPASLGVPHDPISNIWRLQR
jgi:hypothetical protein